jgi:hypothetical protein
MRARAQSPSRAVRVTRSRLSIRKGPVVHHRSDFGSVPLWAAEKLGRLNAAPFELILPINLT